jgi:arylsulfatase
VEAVEEMDWIAGEILDTLKLLNIDDRTLVFFTSDNGPWVAEKSCSGSKGPFEGRWLQDNVDQSCTACPHEYIPSPTLQRPRRCVYQGKRNSYFIDGVHCGEDTGLGSVWEANIRMPALVKWPGYITPGTESMDMVSTLDVVPTVLGIVGIEVPSDIDGKYIGHELFQTENFSQEKRILFFWRDGFRDGPLPAPYGRFDVVAAKLGNVKAWFYTKSSHYNDDEEVYHNPPLLFDVLNDPAEAFPLNPDDHQDTIEQISYLIHKHKNMIDWAKPLTTLHDPKYIPCIDHSHNCRSKSIVSSASFDFEEIVENGLSLDPPRYTI